MSALASFTSFDYQPANMVPVIASFDTEGHVTPLWVRINGNAYKIESFWLSSQAIDIYEYKCRIIDGNFLKPLCLTFYGREKIWLIPAGR